MKCVLPGNNVKVFGRAIHCLSKIGEDLYFEPLDNGLALRTVNSSRSAYACFLFAKTFFMQYHASTIIKDNSPDVVEDDDPFRCRITMKSCLAVFKSLSSLEKTVDKCRISVDNKECRLVFQLHCKHGIVKTYNLTYQETETLQAVFSKDLCPNRIIADAKELCDVVMNFQTSQEEITVSVNPQQVSFKNYVDDEPDPKKVLHSEMFLSPEEFEDYTIGVDTEVTFCLKELRAILAFADGAGLPVSLHFETTGKPIVFAIDGEQKILEATFVLATLADAPASQVSCSQLSTQRTQTKINTSSKQRRSQQQAASQRHQQVTQQNSRQSREQRLPNGHGQRGDNEDRPSTSRVESTMSVGDTTAMDVEFPDDVMLAAGDAAMERLSQQENQAQHANDDDNNEDDLDRTQCDISPSPVIPIVTSNFRQPVPRPSLRLTHTEPTTKDNAPDNGDDDETPSQHNRTLLANFETGNKEEEEEEGGRKREGEAPVNISIVQEVDVPSDNDDYEFIPGTPPSKKFKSMFFGASQSQSQSGNTKSKHNITVLAEDTDEEDSD